MRGDGIDVKQKERLKDRKGIKLKGRKLSEKERWIEVFKILFKDHDPERIPSPCEFTPQSYDFYPVTNAYRLRQHH
jgi:hypothetical protein